jgi:ubiquitin C-terminal hydrolase
MPHVTKRQTNHTSICGSQCFCLVLLVLSIDSGFASALFTIVPMICTEQTPRREDATLPDRFLSRVERDRLAKRAASTLRACAAAPPYKPRCAQRLSAQDIHATYRVDKDDDMQLLAVEAGLVGYHDTCTHSDITVARRLWHIAATDAAFDSDHRLLYEIIATHVDSVTFLYEIADCVKSGAVDDFFQAGGLAERELARHNIAALQMLLIAVDALLQGSHLGADALSLAERWRCCVNYCIAQRGVASFLQWIGQEGARKERWPSNGLANIGNSCYFNSAVQLLCRVYGSAFVELAKDRPEWMELEATKPRERNGMTTSCRIVSPLHDVAIKQDATMRLLSKLVLHVRGEARLADAAAQDLRKLLSDVQRLNPEAAEKFANGRQSDSSSMATHLLTLIEVSARGLRPPQYFASETLESSSDQQWRAFCLAHPCMFTQAQCGQLTTEISCEACDGPGFAPPAFSGFSALSIPASTEGLRNVQAAVNAWGNGGTRLQDIPFRCRCGAALWRQRRRISRFPATGVLLVTINREYHDERGRAIKWPGGVVLPATVTFPGVGGVMFDTVPVAACVHSGTVEGGHYYCTLATNEGRTVIANDSYVYEERQPNAKMTSGSLFAFQIKKCPVPRRVSPLRMNY